jgi:outer membrane protein assembly factor BamB
MPAIVNLDRRVAAVALALALSACSSASTPSPTPPPSSSSTPSSTASAADWTAYHHDASRSGLATGVATFRAVRRSWTSPALDGAIYAEPLVVGSHVIVATEANMVYALDAATGAVAWRASLGTPVNGGTLPCGNIDPSGITGTPVADARAGTLYAVAFLAAGPHHELFALDASSGTVRWRRPIDPPGLSPNVEQQRGALALDDGRVYVPFGGLQGDCGPYKGAIVSSDAAGSGPLASYVVPTGREGGIWQPAGAAADANGDLWVTTGNSASQSSFDYGNAVLRLTPALRVRDWFAPSDWARLNAGDIDLGSVGVVLLPSNRALAAGKAGVAYLLDRSKLGHIGGQLASTSVCSRAFGTAVASGSMAFIPCEDSLAGVRIGASSLTRVWRHPGAAGPAIVFAGAVWSIGYGGRLLALDPSTGVERFSAGLDRPPSRFVSPAAFGNRIYAPSGDRIVSFAVS